MSSERAFLELGEVRVDALDGGSLSFAFERPGRKLKLELAVRPLLVRAPSWSCLVDPGFGPADPDRRERFSLRDPVPLEEQCARLGLGAGPDCVVLTHLHFDHAAGALADLAEASEAAAPRLRFPRARHYVHEIEWEAALSDGRGGKLATRLERALGGAPEPISALELDAIEAELAPGHTEGLVALWIGYAAKRALFAADLIPTQRFLTPRLDRMADQEPETALRTRTGLLERCFAEDAHVCFYHDVAMPWTRVVPGEAHALGRAWLPRPV